MGDDYGFIFVYLRCTGRQWVLRDDQRLILCCGEGQRKQQGSRMGGEAGPRRRASLPILAMLSPGRSQVRNVLRNDVLCYFC